MSTKKQVRSAKESQAVRSGWFQLHPETFYLRLSLKVSAIMGNPTLRLSQVIAPRAPAKGSHKTSPRNRSRGIMAVTSQDVTAMINTTLIA